MRFAPPWVAVGLLALIRACCRRLVMVARLVVLRGVSVAESEVGAHMAADSPQASYRAVRLCRLLAVSRLWVSCRLLPRPVAGFRVRARLLLAVVLPFLCCRA